MSTEQAPTTLAEAIRLAIDDTRAVQAAYGEKVHPMHSAWLIPWKSYCYACLAGMVMFRLEHRNPLKRGGGRERSPKEYGPEWERALRALEYVRKGEWEEAIWTMHTNIGREKALAFHREMSKSQTQGRAAPINNTFESWEQMSHFIQDIETTWLEAIERLESIYAPKCPAPTS